MGHRDTGLVQCVVLVLPTRKKKKKEGKKEKKTTMRWELGLQRERASLYVVKGVVVRRRGIHDTTNHHRTAVYIRVI